MKYARERRFLENLNIASIYFDEFLTFNVLNDIEKKLVIKKHDVNNGVVLYRPIHNNFHEMYGKGNNTLEQFNEFISYYYSNTKLL